MSGSFYWWRRDMKVIDLRFESPEWAESEKASDLSLGEL